MLEFKLETERQDVPALVEECPEISLVRCAVGLKKREMSSHASGVEPQLASILSGRFSSEIRLARFPSLFSISSFQCWVRVPARSDHQATGTTPSGTVISSSTLS
jgi:hypothetical protein